MVEGEHRLLPDWDFEGYCEFMINNYGQYPTMEQQADFVMSGIEDELIIRCGLESQDFTETTSKYRGRTKQPRVKRTPVLPRHDVKGPQAEDGIEK